MNYQAKFEELLGVSLRPNAQGKVMTRCPLHDDKIPSLSINVDKGIWHCYAGCGGGIIQDLAEKLGKIIRHKRKDETIPKTRITK